MVAARTDRTLCSAVQTQRAASVRFKENEAKKRERKGLRESEGVNQVLKSGTRSTDDSICDGLRLHQSVSAPAQLGAEKPIE